MNSFILTMWYVNIDEVLKVYDVPKGFILTMWYVNL